MNGLLPENAQFQKTRGWVELLNTWCTEQKSVIYVRVYIYIDKCCMYYIWTYIVYIYIYAYVCVRLHLFDFRQNHNFFIAKASISSQPTATPGHSLYRTAHAKEKNKSESIIFSSTIKRIQKVAMFSKKTNKNLLLKMLGKNRCYVLFFAKKSHRLWFGRVTFTILQATVRCEGTGDPKKISSAKVSEWQTSQRPLAKNDVSSCFQDWCLYIVSLHEMMNKYIDIEISVAIIANALPNFLDT